MIVLSLSADRDTKYRLRAASIDLAVMILRDGGFLSAAWFACGMIPVAIAGFRSRFGPGPISVLQRDSDSVIQSIRRSGIRYVADLLVSAGGHDDAAAYLGEVADHGDRCSSWYGAHLGGSEDLIDADVEATS